MNTTQEYKQRIATVQSWLLKAGWTVHDSAFKDEAIVDKAVKTFGYKDKSRAQILVAKSARLLRGEYVQLAGGAPTRRAALNVPRGTKLIYQRQAIDMSVDESFVVEALNGDGGEIEFQRIRPDGMTEIIAIRLPDEDET